jgi:hypothetical protein
MANMPACDELSRAGQAQVCLVDLVCFVYLVDLVHLVSFVQPKNQTDQTNQTTVFSCWRTFSASSQGDVSDAYPLTGKEL